MRNITQSEVRAVSGSVCRYHLAGVFACNLLFIGYYYLYSQDINSFEDFRILPITLMVTMNMSI